MRSVQEQWADIRISAEQGPGRALGANLVLCLADSLEGKIDNIGFQECIEIAVLLDLLV